MSTRMLSLDWYTVVQHLATIAFAYILALPIAWNRERAAYTAGLRTFPLVAVSSCCFVLIAYEVIGQSEQQSRIIQGMITGVGFIGGGAILRAGGRTQGTSTAASLWATGAMGTAVGFGLDDIAIAISLVTYATFRLMSPLKTLATPPADADTPPE